MMTSPLDDPKAREVAERCLAALAPLPRADQLKAIRVSAILLDIPLLDDEGRKALLQRYEEIRARTNEHCEKIKALTQKIREEVTRREPRRAQLLFTLRHEGCPEAPDDDPAPELVLSVEEATGCGVYTCPRCGQQVVGLAEFTEEP